MPHFRALRLAATSALVLAFVTLPLVSVQAASAPPQPQASVSQDECTLKGTAGPDVLRGTAGRDVICGLDGDDVIYGLAGDDVLDGGGGQDELHGGAGDDRLIGGPGRDVLIDTTLSVSAVGDYPVVASVREVGDTSPFAYATGQVSCADDVTAPPSGGTAKPILLFISLGNQACGGLSAVRYDVSQKVAGRATNTGPMTLEVTRRPGSKQVDSITAKCRGDFECFLTSIDNDMAVMVRLRP